MSKLNQHQIALFIENIPFNLRWSISANGASEVLHSEVFMLPDRAGEAQNSEEVEMMDDIFQELKVVQH